MERIKSITATCFYFCYVSLFTVCFSEMFPLALNLLVALVMHFFTYNLLAIFYCIILFRTARFFFLQKSDSHCYLKKEYSLFASTFKILSASSLIPFFTSDSKPQVFLVVGIHCHTVNDSMRFRV